MSIRSAFGTLSLASLLLLSACDEEEPNNEEDSGAEPSQEEPRKRDGGVSGSKDGGSNNNPDVDGGVGNDSGTGEDSGVVPDGGTSSDGGVSATRFFLPTKEADNTAQPTVELDAQGNVHTVFPAYAGGRAYYTFCPADGSCKSSQDAKVVKFETEGTVGNAMLALTKDGKPRVLLSTYMKVYYASCEQNCTEQSSWTVSMILDHGSNREITGEALALDAQGRPRFLMHTYRALWGIGQKTPEEILASCDANCQTPESWKYDVVAKDEIWYGSDLRFDAQGAIHVATTLIPFEGLSPKEPIIAYVTCSQNCNTEGNFNGVSFYAPYESRTEAVNMYPATSLALTSTGKPRLAMIAKSSAGAKQLLFAECGDDCTNGSKWQVTLLTEHDKINSGIDLALDTTDHPRVAYTFNYNILMWYCDQANCAVEGNRWDDLLIEKSSDIPPDNIFLWPNCTIGAWFLHDPSLAITKSGKPRVAYQARDISGGFSQPDPTRPRCTAGTDMTWSRLAIL